MGTHVAGRSPRPVEREEGRQLARIVVPRGGVDDQLAVLLAQANVEPLRVSQIMPVLVPHSLTIETAGYFRDSSEAYVLHSSNLVSPSNVTLAYPHFSS